MLIPPHKANMKFKIIAGRFPNLIVLINIANCHTFVNRKSAKQTTYLTIRALVYQIIFDNV